MKIVTVHKNQFVQIQPSNLNRYGTSSEKARYLISKCFKRSEVSFKIKKNGCSQKLTSIVGMFHNCHQLNSIITKIFDTLQDISRKLFVSTHPSFRSRNSDMCFVNLCTMWFCGAFVLEHVFLRCRRIPKPCIIYGRYRQVLSNSFNPSR